MGDQEDILRRKQFSTTALHNLNNFCIRKKRIKENVRLKFYKTIVKPVFMYNNQTWDLPVNDKHNLESFQCQQLRAALHIKFPHVISNNDLYQRTNEIPLTFTILKNRWKLFGHIFCLHPQTPAQQSMRHHFSPSQNSSFRIRQLITLPIALIKDLVRASEHFNFSRRNCYTTVSVSAGPRQSNRIRAW